MPMKDKNSLFQIPFKDRDDKEEVVRKCVQTLRKMGVDIEIIETAKMQ